jgi:hypothetical protein
MILACEPISQALATEKQVHLQLLTALTTKFPVSLLPARFAHDAEAESALT